MTSLRAVAGIGLLLAACQAAPPQALPTPPEQPQATPTKVTPSQTTAGGAPIESGDYRGSFGDSSFFASLTMEGTHISGHLYYQTKSGGFPIAVRGELHPMDGGAIEVRLSELDPQGGEISEAKWVTQPTGPLTGRWSKRDKNLPATLERLDHEVWGKKRILSSRSGDSLHGFLDVEFAHVFGSVTAQTNALNDAILLLTPKPFFNARASIVRSEVFGRFVNLSIEGGPTGNYPPGNFMNQNAGLTSRATLDRSTAKPVAIADLFANRKRYDRLVLDTLYKAGIHADEFVATDGIPDIRPNGDLQLGIKPPGITTCGEKCVNRGHTTECTLVPIAALRPLLRADSDMVRDWLHEIEQPTPPR